MLYRLKLLILPILGCLLSGILMAQSFRPGINIDIIGPERGLPDRNINIISQDKLGFIWIGAGTGLFRYDGYKFEKYNHLLSTSANEISVHEIINDKLGNLWVTHRAGVSKIDPYYLTGNLLPGKSIDSAVKRASLPLRIYAGKNGQLWVALNDGYFLILNNDLKITATFRSEYSGPNLQNKGHYATFMTSANNGDLFLYANRDYIDRVSVNGKKVKRFNFPEFKSKGVSFIPGYVEYRNDSLFVIEYMSYESPDVFFVELFIYEGRFGKQYKSQTAFVHSTTTDSLGNVWQSNGYNLHIRKKGEDRFENVTSIFEEKVGPGKYLGGLFTSRDGTVWMNTNAELLKINIARDNFNRYLNIPATNESTVGTSMRGMMEDRNGNVWVCSYGYMEKDMAYCLHQLKDNKIEHKRMISSGQESFLGFYPMYKMAPAGTDLIAVTDGLLLLKINPATMKTYQFELRDSTAGSEFVNITPINDSLLWLGSRNGMFKLNARTLENINYNRLDPSHYINNTRVNFFMRWGANWLATTSKGVYCIRDDGKIISYYGSEKGAVIPLPATTYYHAFDDGRKLYLGSSAGLIEVDTLARTSEIYTVDEGLPDNNIYAVLNDTLGNLWLSTNNGLARFNTHSRKVRNYFVRDGLSHMEFNNASYLKSSDGTLYFGGLNGFVSFSPYTIDTTALPVTNANLVNVSWYSQHGNKQYAYQQSFKDNRLRFEPGSRMIEFSFMVPEYLRVSQNRFRYKLMGWNDDNWIAFEAGNRLILNSVPAGTYKLIVQHSVSGGEWSRNQWEGEIIILQPWYNRYWFYLLLAATAVALAYGFYRYRMNQLMAVLNVRNRISADMHDEIGSTLSSISYFSQAVMMQSTDDKVKEVLQRIKANAQQVQESLSDIVWSVKPGNDQAESIFSRMYHFGHEFTEAKGIAFESIVDPSLNTVKMDMDKRRDLYLIFKEAVNNAVKYSECSKISVSIQPQGQKIRMEISDDGKGFDMNQLEMGNGLSNMQLRAKQMKGVLQIVSAMGKGTTVRLVF
jgi:ligand-binding sensor domain-containing protein/two-component sensor histidine kinase